MWQYGIALSYTGPIMVDPPTPLQWSRHPLKDAPARGLIVAVILLLASSLVLHQLGASAVSALLIIVFLFSLRDFLLPTAVTVDEHGLRVSSPLTGAAHWPWEDIDTLDQQGEALWLRPRRGRRRRLPAPDAKAAMHFAAWLDWWRHGMPEDELPALDGEAGDA
jgi:hypothetical protein